ncbi:MAG: PEP-CTERM sorting domain-containing protein [Verrucomicrobiae bacterium]|nr:PEP-CTERM sorting domain-containing protein [Verrucomicrobiae bacterium]
MCIYPKTREASALVACMFAMLCATDVVNAALSITVGNIDLQPNQSGQTVSFFVNNTDASTDVGVGSFRIQVVDGEDTTTAPTITSVDAITGTPFDGMNTGELGMATGVRRWESSLTAFPSAVPFLNGDLIATVTFDTTGFFFGDGPFSVSLTSTGPGGPYPTEYRDGSNNPIFPTLTDGQITIVPEPSTSLLLALSMGAAFFRRRR